MVDLLCERCGTAHVDEMYARLAQIRFLKTLCRTCYTIVKTQWEAEQTYIEAGALDLREDLLEEPEPITLVTDKGHECASCGAVGSDVMACDMADMIHLCSDCADRLATTGHIRLSNGMPLSVSVGTVGGGA